MSTFELEIDRSNSAKLKVIGCGGSGCNAVNTMIEGGIEGSWEIEFMGRSIRGQGPWDLVKQGLVMVPEGRGTFTRMTITENLQMGAFVRTDKDIEAVVIALG